LIQFGKSGPLRERRILPVLDCFSCDFSGCFFYRQGWPIGMPGRDQAHAHMSSITVMPHFTAHFTAHFMDNQ
jgi:hypothetical protein